MGKDSAISNGCIIANSKLTHSILSFNVVTEQGSEITDSLILGNNVIGSRTIIKKAIIDRGVFIPDNVIIGLDKDHDRKRGFTISKHGVTIVPRKYRF